MAAQGSFFTAVKETPGGTEKQGKNYEFITPPPDKFGCVICAGMLREPHLTECCGNNFCFSCLEGWEKSVKGKKCPHCRAVNFKHILDKRSKREIDELKVRCSFHSKGCKWEGELASLEEHLKACSISDVKCSQCFCTFKHNELQKHQKEECEHRRSNCVYCNTKGTHRMLTSSFHLSCCPDYPLRCPNKCSTQTIKRSEMVAHRSKCRKEPVDCPFKEAGCKMRPDRNNLNSHLDVENKTHMLCLMTAFQQAQAQLRQQSKQLQEQSTQLQKQSEQIRDLQLHRGTSEFAMKSIGESVEELLKTPNLPPAQQGPLQSIKSCIASASSLLQLSPTHPYLTMTMSNFAANPTWTSPPFYVNEGYKMCLKLYPNPFDGKTISIELNLLQGEFDGELSWPCTVNFKCMHLQLCTFGVFSNSFCVGEYTSKSVLRPHQPSSTLWQCVNIMENPPPLRFTQKDNSVKLRLEYRTQPEAHAAGRIEMTSAYCPASNRVIRKARQRKA